MKPAWPPASRSTGPPPANAPCCCGIARNPRWPSTASSARISRTRARSAAPWKPSAGSMARQAEADLKRAGRDGGALLAVITGRGGDFGLSLAADASPTHDAVADFAKTVALELEGPRTKVVDLDASDPLPILRQKLIDELAADDDTLQVGLPGDRRLTVAPQHAPLGAPRLWTVGPDWVILLTGGARGITAEIARLLAGRQHPTLILAGASPLPGDERPDTAGITEPAKLKLALTARLRAAGAGVRP